MCHCHIYEDKVTQESLHCLFCFSMHGNTAIIIIRPGPAQTNQEATCRYATLVLVCSYCAVPASPALLWSRADPWLMLIPLCFIALIATEWQSKTNRWDASHMAQKHRWRQLIDGDVQLAEGEAWAGVWTWLGRSVLPFFFCWGGFF